MNRIHKSFIVLVLTLVVVSAKAQNVSPVDFMRLNPYQINANPAADLPYKSVMSLLVGNNRLDLQNTTLRYDNFFDFDAQGRPAAVNLRKLANSLEEDNFMSFDAGIDFFTLYKRPKYGMVTMNWGVRVQGDARYNDGLFKLLGYGNGAFVGEDHPAKVNLDLNAMAYQEFAVGYQLNVSEKLSLGWTTKLLFGVADVKTDAFDVTLTTDADSYALRMQEDIAVSTSLPNAVYLDNKGELKGDGPFSVGELFRNPGFGVDLAAEYRFNEHFSAVAAVHDLGFIHWGKNNIGMTGKVNDAGQFYDNGDFLYNGLDVDQLQLIVSDDSYREHFLDTLQEYFQVELAPAESYNTSLNTNLLLRGNYEIDTHNRFSAQVQGRFMNSGFRPAFTLAYSGSFYNMLDVCATYTVSPNSYDNIGIGIAGVFDTFHIYLTTNNIIGFFKPLNASGFNVQVGVVFNMFQGDPRIRN